MQLLLQGGNTIITRVGWFILLFGTSRRARRCHGAHTRGSSAALHRHANDPTCTLVHACFYCQCLCLTHPAHFQHFVQNAPSIFIYQTSGHGTYDSHFIIFKIVEHILKLTQELCKKVLPNSWSNNLKFLCEKFNKTQQCFTTQLLLTLNPIMLVNTRVDISISVK